MNKDKEMGLLDGKKYNIITFGCQMNEHDSETIAGNACRSVAARRCRLPRSRT